MKDHDAGDHPYWDRNYRRCVCPECRVKRANVQALTDLIKRVDDGQVSSNRLAELLASEGVLAPSECAALRAALQLAEAEVINSGEAWRALQDAHEATLSALRESPAPLRAAPHRTEEE